MGAPKCGTTTMDELLRQHPEIYIPEKKEIHFFGTDLTFTDKRFTRISEKYNSWFSKIKNEKRVGASSVWYLFSKLAAREIKNYCQTASIIIMLRNPVDMLYSLHSQFLFDCNEEITDFEMALKAEDQRKKGKLIPRIANPVEGLFYRETVKFSEQISRYFETFGRENVHIIILDDFKNNTPGIYKETIEFLKVNNSFQPDFKVLNPNKYARNIALQKFIRHPPWPYKRFEKASLPIKFRTKMKETLEKANTLYKPRSPMEQKLKESLQNEFKPEVEQLSELLGRDLSHWCKV